MSSRNIAIRKDVYDQLRREQRTGESFSRVLLRLLERRGSLDDLEGAWGGPPPRLERTRWQELRNLRVGDPASRR